MGRNLSIKQKITILALIIGVVVFICSITLAVREIRAGLNQAAENKINEITELAYNVVAGYKKRADNGELTVDQAKALALKDLANFRYQGFNYVWVNGYDNKFLVHPTKPRGSDSSEVADIHGKRFFYELTQMVKNGKTGYVKYEWTKPGDKSKKQYPKISTAKGFSDWQWVIATGVYTDEIDNIISQTVWVILGINLVVLIVLIAIVSATFIKGLVSSMNKITADLQQSSEQVADASQYLESASHKLAQGSTEQAASIQETSSTLEETSAMVFKNNENTTEAAHLARQAKEFADKSSIEMNEMTQSMEKLKDSSNAISRIIKAIDDISFQTNLLALNAAVEAARAGDAGKGFAVVAEEVRNLAQKSAQAAKETDELINTNIKLSEQGANITKNISGSISEIDNQIGKVSDLLNEIAIATKEQSIGIEQINKAVAQMEQVLQTNANTAEDSSNASEGLAAQTQLMNEIVNQLTSLVNGSK